MSEQKMPAINQVALSGYLTEERKFRYTGHGGARLQARLLFSRPYRDDDGCWQEEISFFDFILVKKSAEYFAERLHKRIYVFVTGRLKSHVWKDEEGDTLLRVEVVRNPQILEETEEKMGSRIS